METLELSKHFRDLDHDQFCSWLRQNDLDVLEKLIRDGSDVKPSDLLPSLFDDGPLGFRAIIEDEIGAGISVKLTLIMRLRNAMAVAANLERPAAEKTSATKHSTAVGIQEAPTKKKTSTSSPNPTK